MKMPIDVPPTALCPRCENIYKEFPATSRRDNKTSICPRCGTEEALFDYEMSIRFGNEKAWLMRLKKK